MYKSLTLLTGLLAATSIGAPLEKRDVAAPPGGDDTILNYALVLEYLERKFYQLGTTQFTEDDFCAAGFDSVFYADLLKIYSDEQTHVAFLSGALGDKAVGEPTFSFPFTDVHSFIGLSAVLEGVGVSAYLGAAPAIANKAYLTAAGSILTVEARHASYIRAWVGDKPYATAFDTPLDFDQVFSLASQFITALPAGTTLPFKAFPALTAAPNPNSDAFEAGNSTVTFTNAYKNAMAAGMTGSQVYAVFYSGLQTYYAAVTVSGDDYTVTVPGANYSMADEPAPAGQVYVLLSTADGTDTMASDENTISGVALLEVLA